MIKYYLQNKTLYAYNKMSYLQMITGIWIGLKVFEIFVSRPQRPGPACHYYSLRPGHLSKIRK